MSVGYLQLEPPLSGTLDREGEGRRGACDDCVEAARGPVA